MYTYHVSFKGKELVAVKSDKCPFEIGQEFELPEVKGPVYLKLIEIDGPDVFLTLLY